MTHVYDTPETLAEAVARRIVELARSAVARAGRFHLGLSGGRTPVGLYRVLAGESMRREVDWPRVKIFFSDERAVPPTDEKSNFRLARDNLVDIVDIPPTHVHRMKGEYPDLEAATIEYETHLSEALDALVLGMGPDGHVASIFPGSSIVDETERRVAWIDDSPSPPARRITITPRVVREAHDVLMLVMGAEKAGAVSRALEEEGSPRDVPARLVRDRDWYIDRAAAAQLRAPAR